MTRIAIVSPYALSVFGGVQEQVLAMSRELARRHHDVLVVAPDGDDHAQYDTPATLQRFGHLLSIPANGSRAPLTLSPVAARNARRSVEHFRPDVVHLHEPFAPVLGWGVLWSHRAPSVATFHRSGDGPALSLTAPLLRAFAKRLDVAVCVSEAAQKTLLRACKLHSTVLFNGFETERFGIGARERTTTPLIVAVGRLENRKGTQHVIRAVLAHNARGADQWRLEVIGDGPERASLEALAARNDAVHFAGALSDADKRAWLRRASVAVAASTRGESFGLTLLEAMASETMVVASDIPGYREAAGTHAVLFAPGDDAALEQAIATAIATETPERIGAAREHAEHWSMHALIERYEALYETAREHFGSGR